MVLDHLGLSTIGGNSLEDPLSRWPEADSAI